MQQQSETVHVWTQPTWRAEAERWIRERVAGLGGVVTRIEHSHVRPWGTVARVVTDAGGVWFKASIAPLAYEVALLVEVEARRPDAVPRLLAADERRAWMLLDDAGTPVTDLHPNPPPIELWRTFLRAYAQLQLDVAEAADGLVAAGVPDRRLPHLLPGLVRVLEADRLVRQPAVSALTDEELRRVRALLPDIEAAIATIGALGLPDSVQHDDLHAWNVCVRDGRYRFIDWGDACVAQPLLSLAVPLAHVAAEDGAAARDAYLEPWTALADEHDLVAAVEAAVLLGHVTGILKWELITAALTDSERVGYEDVITRRLRYMLGLACA